MKKRNKIQDKPTGVVQVDSGINECVAGSGKRLRFSENILRLAQTEYDHQYGKRQDYERMQERSGLSVFEVVTLLADYVERLGGKPTAPRSEPGQ